MKTRVRVIFWLHMFVGAYCMASGVLDSYGRPRGWVIPNAAVFCLLLASAFIFPLLAAAFVKGSGSSHPVLLVFTHLVVSVAQVSVGLVPLIS